VSYKKCEGCARNLPLVGQVHYDPDDCFPTMRCEHYVPQGVADPYDLSQPRPQSLREALRSLILG